jgi:hypothetical protein
MNRAQFLRSSSGKSTFASLVMTVLEQPKQTAALMSVKLKIASM